MADGNDKLNIPGVGEITGTKVSVDSATDTSAILADGTAIHFRAVLVEAFRTNEFDGVGNPKYYFQFGLVTSEMEIPDELKKGAARV